MKLRTNYVSNSSSSSFTCYIEKDKINQFKKDFEDYVTFIKKMFPKYEDEEFPLEFKTYTEKEIVKHYIINQEGVKHPSEDLIEFFYDKLKKNNENIFWCLDSVEIKYWVDTESYSTIGFQNLCENFMNNYNENIK